MPSAAWSPTVQRNSYLPGPSIASPDWVFPGPKIGVPPRSAPPFWTCRSCASEPLLRSTNRTAEGFEVPLFTITFLGSKPYSLAPNAIGWLWPTVTVPFCFWPPSPFLSSPPLQPVTSASARAAAGRGLRMAADNMRAHAEATPLLRLLPRGLRRVRHRLRGPQDRGLEERFTERPPRRDPVQRALQRLPLARRRRRVRLEARGQREGRRAHRRPQLQRAQGDPRGRALRDPQRRLLGGDHAREHRGGAGGARRRRVPRALRRLEVDRRDALRQDDEVGLRALAPCST